MSCPQFQQLVALYAGGTKAGTNNAMILVVTAKVLD